MLSLCKEMGDASHQWDGQGEGEGGAAAALAAATAGRDALAAATSLQGRLSPASPPRAISPPAVPRTEVAKVEVAEMGVQTARRACLKRSAGQGMPGLYAHADPPQAWVLQ